MKYKDGKNEIVNWYYIFSLPAQQNNSFRTEAEMMKNSVYFNKNLFFLEIKPFKFLLWWKN